LTSAILRLLVSAGGLRGGDLMLVENFR